jgi:hypothetical protein
MTHITFDSDKIDWSSYLSSQQVGQGFRMVGRGNDEDGAQYFRGLRYMRGYGAGSIIKGALGSLGRFLMPIASNIIETAGREADQTLGRIGADLVTGKPVFEAVKEQATKGLSNIGQKIQQCGKGRKIPNKKHIRPKINANFMENIINSKRVKNVKRRRDYLDLD